MYGFLARTVKTLFLLLLGGVLLVALALGCGSRPGERDFEDGLRELKRGRHARARVLLEKSIDKRPASEENAQAYNYLGVASARMGQLDRAISEFDEAHRLEPSLFEPTYNLAVLMYEGGDINRAKKLLQRAATADLKDPRALEYLGHISLGEEAWGAARRVLSQALERAPYSPSVLTSLALAERHTTGTTGALEYLMRALEKDPDYPPALYNLGVLYEKELNDAEGAISFYKKFLAVASEGDQKDAARASYEALLLVSDVTDAGTPDGRGHDTDLEPVTRTVRTFEELSRDARVAAEIGETEDALNLCLEAAEQAKQQRDKKKQESALQLAIELCPERAEGYYAWGAYCLDQARYKPALQAFKRARVLNPRWVESYLGLAEAAAETAEFDAALVTLKQALRLAPDNAEVRWALAILYDQHLGVTEQAIQAYREFESRFNGDPRIVKARDRLVELEAIQRTARRAAEPETAEVTPEPRPVPTPAPRPEVELRVPRLKNTSAAVQAYNRGTTYQERQDWDRAIYYYRRAIENDSSFANAYYNLGSVYRARQELGLAKDAYLHAVQLQPKTINARYNLALVYMELNMNSAAIEQLRAVLRLNPKHASSHYVLGLLYSMSPRARNLARNHYEQYLQLAPNAPYADTVRAWLRTNS